ncbi:hypothetical protein LINPERHAP2_LOCUS9490 [Linum perenne]
MIKLTSYAMNRKRSEYIISKILDGAFKSEEVVDKEQKDDFSRAHSSSQSLSSCVVQNEILTKAYASPSHSTKVIAENELTTTDDSTLELSDDTTIADAKMALKKRKKSSLAGDKD